VPGVLVDSGWALAESRRRLDAARGFADRYNATGYRAPSLLRTRALLKDLSTRYRYDSSMDWVRGDSDDDFQRQRLSQHILRTGGFYRQWR